MENQHRKIKGYRELNEEEIALINEVKEMGQELDCLIAKVTMVNAGLSETGDAAPYKGDASRWVAIAKTDFQTGLMALTRAVAKPDFF